MNFKAYLLDEGHRNDPNYQHITTEISKEKFINLYEDKCSEARASNPIYRGLDGRKELFLHTKARKKYRKSRDGSSILNMVIDNSPYWSKFPKRGYAHMCTLSKTEAYEYGAVYRVFPFNRTKIAIAPQRDFFYCFDNVIGTRSSTRQFLQEINTFFKEVNGRYINEKSISTIKKDLKFFDINKYTILSGFKNGKKEYLNIKRVVRLLSKYTNATFYEALQEAFQPKGFSVTRPIDIPRGNREVWFVGPCIMLKYNDETKEFFK